MPGVVVCVGLRGLARAGLRRGRDYNSRRSLGAVQRRGTGCGRAPSHRAAAWMPRRTESRGPSPRSPVARRGRAARVSARFLLEGWVESNEGGADWLRGRPFFPPANRRAGHCGACEAGRRVSGEGGGHGGPAGSGEVFVAEAPSPPVNDVSVILPFGFSHLSQTPALSAPAQTRRPGEDGAGGHGPASSPVPVLA